MVYRPKVGDVVTVKVREESYTRGVFVEPGDQVVVHDINVPYVSRHFQWAKDKAGRSYRKYITPATFTFVRFTKNGEEHRSGLRTDNLIKVKGGK